MSVRPDVREQSLGRRGFANPGSVGIMIGGMGVKAPQRRSEIVAPGARSLVAGTLAAYMTGAVAGLFNR